MSGPPPRNGESAGRSTDAPQQGPGHHNHLGTHHNADGRQVLGSQQVSFTPVIEFWQAVVTQANVGPLPWPGTPGWCSLADGDPRKVLALAEFGVHHAVRVEAAQTARAEASQAISGAADWPRISREVRGRSEFRAARPWAKRVAR